MPEYTSVSDSPMQVVEIETGLIDPTNTAMRFNYDATSIGELADSIREVGLLLPLIVAHEGDRYRVIAGNRRLLACRAANLRRVPVVIRESDVDDELLVAVSENVNREDMNPLEEAVAFGRWVEATGRSSTELAKLLGRHRSYVEKRVMLLSLDDDTQGALVRGTITLHHALELRRVEDELARRYLLNLVEQNGASVAVLRGWVESYQRDPDADVTEAPPYAPPPPVTMPPSASTTCFFCGRTAEQSILHALFVCPICEAALRESQASGQEDQGV